MLVAKVDGEERISSLTLSGKVVDSEYLSKLAAFSNLKTLTLSNLGTDATGVAEALGESNVEKLTLIAGVDGIDGNSLKKLAVLPRLNSLTVISADAKGHTEAVRAVRPKLSFTTIPQNNNPQNLNGTGRFNFEMGYRF